jgi:hypothetical protein
VKFLRLPKVDRNTGIYLEPLSGHQFTTRDFLAKKHEADNDTIQGLISPGIPTMSGRNRADRKSQLYDMDALEASPEFVAWKALPKVDDSGRLVDEESGKTYIVISSKAHELGVYDATLAPFLKDISRYPAKDRGNHPNKLICETDLEADPKYQKWKSLPMVDAETKQHTDKDGLHWVTANAATDLYPASITKIDQYLGRVRSQPGRGGDGHPTKLYCREDLDTLGDLKDFCDLPVLSDQEQQEGQGHNLVYQNEISRKYRIDYRTLCRFFRGLVSVSGRDNRGHPTVFYDEEQVLDNGLRDYLAKRGR